MWLVSRRSLVVAPLSCLSILVLLLWLLFYFCGTFPVPTRNGQIAEHPKQQSWLVLANQAGQQLSDSENIEEKSSSSSSSGEQDDLEVPSRESFISSSSSSNNSERNENEEGARKKGRETSWEAAQQKKRIRRLAHLDRRPILNEFSFPANLVQGMRFVLMCQVLDGDLPIQIKWFKDQQELLAELSSYPQQVANQQQQPRSVSELEIEFLSNDELGSSLLFRKVQQKHSGNYTCLAQNHLGSTSFSSSLSVKIPPKWRIKPQDQAESIIGNQATIDCQSEGNPNPFIRWKFSPILQQQQQQQASPTNSLTTTSTEHQNGHLMASPTAELLQAIGSFKLINSNHHVQTLENGSLTIRLVTKEDEGFYLCEADNGLEPSLSKVLRLIVHQQAQIIDDLRLLGASADPLTGQQQTLMNPPGSPVIKSVRLQSSSASNATSQQQPLRVLCQPAGDLPLTVDWLKDDQLIYTHTISASETSAIISSSSADHQLQPQQQQLARLHVNTRRSSTRQPQPTFESELYLTGLRRSDAGLFACSARNAFGRSERRMKLVLQEPPEPPEVVDVGHIGARSIGLRWLPSGFDGNSPILKYIVEYRRVPMASHADPQQSTLTTTTTTTTTGWPDEQLLAIPVPTVAATTEQDQLSVAFTGQSERIIQPTKATDQQQPVTHTVHDLEPLTRYSMRVIAVNAVGRSRPSIALTLRTEEEVPSVIPSLVGAIVLGSRSVKLHWTLVHSSEREIIDGFFIGYRSFDIHDQQQQQQDPKLSTNALQDGQQPTFTYKTVRLNRAPSNGNGPVRELHDPNLAYISPLSSITKSSPQANNNNLQHVISSSFEYIIGGLERNTEYSILIQCFNKKGAGPTSDPVIFKTFANDPPEKLAISADEISESSVRVNWRFMFQQSSSGSSSEKHQLVDGFVLAFAKLINNNNLRSLSSSSSSSSNEVAVGNRQQLTVGSVTAAARIATSPANNFTGQQASVDQWQALQLAPQQRNHQLKNLECGTSYAMKIWAFNKIGKGEPSDLVTVSTRGKAPIAPDRRSFLSINSTQVRLHLSAWYDGGCEIDKFIVQYKVRGQHEWTLVSNNILRDQLSVVIRDLLPATSYELLVGAQNQVGPTEVKYRFITLDLDGKQVASSIESNSFASSSPDDSELVSSDYSDADGTRKHELWPDSYSSKSKSMLFLGQFMNSPLALVLSLCFFVVLFMVLVFYKFNAQANHSSSPSCISTLNLNSSSNKSSAGGGRHSGGDPNMTLITNDSELIGGAHSVANTSGGSGCTTDGSPARMSTFHQQQHSIRMLNSTNNDYSPVPESCHYQPFCNPMVGQQQQQQQQHLNNQNSSGLEYSHYGLPSSTTYEAASNLLYSGLSVQQRSATMDQVSQSSGAGGAIMIGPDQDGSRQLIQMLMLQGQNQAHLDQIPESDPVQQQHDHQNGSYAAAALTTMARGGRQPFVSMTTGAKQHGHPFQAQTLGRQQTSSSSSSNNNNNFVNPTMD